MNNIKFSCNGCGGCCHGGISLTYNEYMNYLSDDFAVTLSITAYDSRNLIEPEFPARSLRHQKKFLKENIYFTHKSPDGRKIAIIPEIITLTPKDVACKQLGTANLCKIYYRRPSVCDIYPYRTDKVLSEISYGLMLEKARAIESKEATPCEGFSEHGELIYTTSPTDQGIYRKINDRLIEMKELKKLMSDFFNHKVVVDDDFANSIYENSKFNSPTGKRIRVSLAEFLSTLDKLNYGSLTKKTIYTIKNNKRNIENEMKRIINIDNKKYQGFLKLMEIDIGKHNEVIRGK